MIQGDNITTNYLHYSSINSYVNYFVRYPTLAKQRKQNISNQNKYLSLYF